MNLVIDIANLNLGRESTIKTFWRSVVKKTWKWTTSWSHVHCRKAYNNHL